MPSQHLVISRIVSALEMRSLQEFAPQGYLVTPSNDSIPPPSQQIDKLVRQAQGQHSGVRQ